MDKSEKFPRGTAKSPYNPYGAFPKLPFPAMTAGEIPSDEQCFALWDKYAMLPNIRRHSLQTAKIATALAQRAAAAGFGVNAKMIRAAALLHDLGKTYSIDHGGSHAQLGAAWVAGETGNSALAQGVLLHVYWPWEPPSGTDIFHLPFFIIYADKRVRHDRIVSLEERFADLKERYGKTPAIIAHIAMAHEQALHLEKVFSRQLEQNINEDTFDCGGLVS